MTGQRQAGRMSKLTDLLRHTLPDTLIPASKKPLEPDPGIHNWVKGTYANGLNGRIFISSDSDTIQFSAVEPVHPLILKWAAIQEDRIPNLLFLDTETTGLSGGTGTMAFMIGVGWIANNQFQTRQYFMTDPAHESDLLKQLHMDVSAFDTVVSFNGKSFDMNLLERRFIFHGLENPFRRWGHIDLLHLSRRLWKHILPGCALQQLEVSLQLTRRERMEDIPGSLIPQVYFDYLRYGQTRELQNVFYHNRIDVQSMVRLLDKISATLRYPHIDSESFMQWIDPVAIAGFFHDMGEVQRSVEIYEHELSSGENIDCMMNLSSLFKSLGEFEKARRLWEVCAERGKMTACVELAKLAEHREKNLSDAIQWTEKAFSLIDKSHPNAVETFDNLIHRRNRILRKMGNKIEQQEFTG